jgi:hypothetical protein
MSIFPICSYGEGRSDGKHHPNLVTYLFYLIWANPILIEMTPSAFIQECSHRKLSLVC